MDAADTRVETAEAKVAEAQEEGAAAARRAWEEGAEEAGRAKAEGERESAKARDEAHDLRGEGEAWRMALEEERARGYALAGQVTWQPPQYLRLIDGCITQL